MRMVSPQVPNQVPVPLNEFTVIQDTDVIRLQNLLINEMIQERSHDPICDWFKSNFIENFNHSGFVVMSTHGTTTITLVPCADTLPVKNVPTWKSV